MAFEQKDLNGALFAIGDKLHAMVADMDAEFTKLHTAYIDMPDELKGHALYKSMGEHIAAVEALLVTLKVTAASFPPPAGDAKPEPWHPAPLYPQAPMPGAAIGAPPAPPLANSNLIPPLAK